MEQYLYLKNTKKILKKVEKVLADGSYRSYTGDNFKINLKK